MSLLLNALKKAEEGSSEQSSEQSSQAASQAVKPQLPQIKAEDSGAQSTASSVLNSIKSNEADGKEEKKQRERVDAARVFGASEDGEEASTSSSGVRRLVVALVVLAGLGGGGYVAVFSGFLSGVDVSGLLGFQSEEVVVLQKAPQSPADQLTTSEEVSVLPVPAIDVQAEIDFADLSFLGNRPSDFDKEEYRQKIAVLTGYDINREIERRKEEELRLIEELSLNSESDSSLIDEDENESDAAALKTSVPEVQTAEISRLAKLELDSKTASDNNLDISFSRSQNAGVINSSIESGVKEEQQQEIDSSSRLAQIDVQVSLDGQERKNLLLQAQQNYYKGRYAEAEAIYREIIRSSPTNRNAIRGLAMVAVATGRYQLAAATYLDLLNFYPNDPIAISELTNLRSDNKENFYEVEKILKNLIGKSSEIDDRVYFSLGNLYSEVGRFNDAQSSYFEAFSRKSENPDYAYNLAVTLDYLNKPRLAIRYYQQALSLSENVAVFGFNVSEVKSRIQQLKLK